MLEFPGLGADGADEPGHSPHSAVRAMTGLLAHLGEVRILGHAVAPWRMTQHGPVAVLVENEDRLAMRWWGDETPPALEPRSLVEIVGRWGLAGTTLVVDTDNVIVVFAPPGDP